MKGNEKLLEALNSLLADELTAISQYMVHGEMCENWGYGKLHEHFRKRAIDEMKHAEKLIGRSFSSKDRLLSQTFLPCTWVLRFPNNSRTIIALKWMPSRPITRPSS